MSSGRTQSPNRRRVLMAASAAAALGGLLYWARTAQSTVPQPDGRKYMQGRAPSIFVGHGSPMNAVQDNAFTQALRRWGIELGLPRAILIISAHWLTEHEVKIGAANMPEMIYDFGGFPRVLYEQQYPAHGAPDLAR